jgi:general secretion pathway protein K
VQSEGLIRAGVEMAGGFITKDPRFAGDGTPYDFPLGDGRVTVYAVSEDAKIDLNKADRLLIEGLFRVLGAGGDEAATISNLIVTWRDPNASQSVGAQAEEFRYNRGVRAATKHPFHDPADLRSIPGISARRIEEALPYLTVLSKGSTVYALGASEIVLAALPGMTPERARQIVKIRHSGASAMDLIRPLLGDAINYAREDRGSAFSLLIEAELGRGYRQTAEVVIVAAEEQNIPYRVVSWNSGSSAEAKLSLVRLASR